MEKEVQKILKDFEEYVDKARHTLIVLGREKSDTMIKEVADKYNDKLFDILLECYVEIEKCYKD